MNEDKIWGWVGWRPWPIHCPLLYELAAHELTNLVI